MSLFEHLENCLISLQRFFEKRPLVLVFPFLLLVLFSASQLPNMRFLLSADQLLDENIPSIARLKSLKESFKDGNPSYVLIRKDKNTFSQEELCKISRWIEEQDLNNPEITSIDNPFWTRKSQYENKRIYFPKIFKTSCNSSQSIGSIDLLKDHPARDFYTDESFRSLLVKLDFRDTPHYRLGNFNPIFAKQLIDSFNTQVFPYLKDVHVSFGGTATYQNYMQDGMQRASILNIAFILFLLVTLKFFLGTWKSGMIYVVTIITTGVIVYGLKAYFDSPFDVLSNSLFLMVGVSALEDFIFVSYLMAKGNPRALRDLIVPGLLTSLTTAIGFFSLMTSDLHIIARLGLWAGVGSMLEWTIIFLVLPALVSLIPRIQSWVQPQNAFIVKMTNDLSFLKIPRKISYLILCSFLLVPMAVKNLKVFDEPEAMFAKDHPYAHFIDNMTATFHWTTSVSIVFPSAINERIVSEISQDPLVHKVHTLKNISQYFHKETPAELQPNIDQRLSLSVLGEKFISNQLGERVIVLLKNNNSEELKRFKNGIQMLCKDECYEAGFPFAYLDFVSKIPETLLESMLLSTILVCSILILLMISLKKTHYMLPVIASSIIGPTLVLLLISFFGLKINFLTCIFASVLIGLTGDNAIYFLCSSRNQRLSKGIDEVSGASFQTCMIMASASIIFCFSYFSPPKTFGILLSAGLIISLLGDVWILRGLLAQDKTDR